MEIFSRDRDVLDNVHDYIANDPVPFLVDVVHRGSSLR
nr:envelope protein [White spot syndrome virus]WRY70793.1 envelope protein [White spot syndrome virus]WRY70962.1 envelope protein [White spot syndrome virus]